MDKEFRRKHHRKLVINLYHPTNPNSTSLFTCSILLIENTFTYANDSKECIIYICFVFLMCVWYCVNEWCVVVSSEVLMHVCLTLRQSVSVELNHVDSAGWGTSFSDLIDSTCKFSRLEFQVYIGMSGFLCEFKGLRAQGSCPYLTSLPSLV